MKFIFSAFLLLLAVSNSFGQTDSTVIFTYQDFIDNVKANHPVAVQASLRLKMGEANLMANKGLFDPKLFSDVTQKYFDDTQYYSNLAGGLKVPTWFGIELQSGYEQNQGIFLNPESDTPGAGLWYAGISLPLGQGLFIDERRTQLRKAQNYLDMTETERQIILNELLFDASIAYWEWSYYYNTMLVYQEALELANVRFEGVKRGAELGDNPFIDTLEAGIQVQNRMISLNQAQLDFNNSTLKLGVYLWDQGIIPLDLSPNTLPEFLEGLGALPVDTRYISLKSSIRSSHPILMNYDLKIKELEIERRWKLEQLKPNLNLKYNAITEPLGGDPFSNYSSNNYTWGFTFGIPVLLRKERGMLEMTDIKIMENELELESKNLMIENKITMALNEWQTTFDQIQIFDKTVEDYLNLLEGERQLFDIGESSVFMVNSRELGYINSQVKLLRYKANNIEAKLRTEYILGILWQN